MNFRSELVRVLQLEEILNRWLFWEAKWRKHQSKTTRCWSKLKILRFSILYTNIMKKVELFPTELEIC